MKCRSEQRHLATTVLAAGLIGVIASPAFVQGNPLRWRHSGRRAWKVGPMRSPTRRATVDLILKAYSKKRAAKPLLFEAAHTDLLVRRRTGDIGQQDAAHWQKIAATYQKLGLLADDTLPAGLIQTALGDGVNVAARLEGINKQFGTTICISDSIYDQVRAEILARPLKRVQVKGRKTEFMIYELLALRASDDPG
jgi:hypothetical protein